MSGKCANEFGYSYTIEDDIHTWILVLLSVYVDGVFPYTAREELDKWHFREPESTFRSFLLQLCDILQLEIQPSASGL